MAACYHRVRPELRASVLEGVQLQGSSFDTVGRDKPQPAGYDAASIVDCVINVDQAQFFLVNAGLLIDQATRSCPNATGSDANVCAAQAFFIVSSFGWAASYLAYAASSCAETANALSVCVGDVTGLVAALLEVAQVANQLVNDCDAGIANSSSDLGARRLTAARPKSGAPKFSGPSASTFARELALARALGAPGNGSAWLPTPSPGADGLRLCTVNVMLGVSYLGRVGLGIDAATRDCTGSETPDDCSMDAFGVISSLAWAVSYLAFAADGCVEHNVLGSLCTASIAEMVAATTATGAAVSGILARCEQPDPGALIAAEVANKAMQR